MQTNILWSGIEYYSLENCVIDVKDNGVHIDSVIVGLYEKKIYRVEYKLTLNAHWEVYHCTVKSQHDDKTEELELIKEQHLWIMNGKYHHDFSGCFDVDIPLTPFTNSLPINRLQLNQDEEKEIDVIYIDILNHEIRRVKQKYIRVSEKSYHYENIPNDFEAEITVDKEGFVIDYPQLFKRTAKLSSNYN